MAQLNIGDVISFSPRWAPDQKRQGTITRLGHDIVWIGCHCLHANDLRQLQVLRSAVK
jgi:hypothetical protein